MRRGPRRGELATLQDVADRAGVSLSTASRTLNGKPSVVRPELRERVLAAARELRYVPNAPAQALASSRTSTIGLVVHDIGDPYFSAIARGVIEVATEAGLFVMICSDNRDPERELGYLASLQAQRARAVILAGSGFEDAELVERTAAGLAAFEGSGGRVACISEHGIDIDAVLPDNAGGARALGELLLGHGHRELGVIGGPPELTTARHRLDGLRGALTDAGVALPDERVVDGAFTRDGGYAATLALLDRAPEVTAIVALTDVMAVGALSALRDRGVDVPGDVSVAGFDDIQLARDVHPALTTVQIPMTELGAQAARLVLDPRDDGGPRRLPVATRVIERASTRPR